MGEVTRGKTAPNRLRATDTFLAVAHPGLLRSMPGPYVDLGFGASPITSVETLRRLRRADPAIRVIGVEIDPARVAAAAGFTEPGLEFRLGGFNLPLGRGERAGAIRAFNVLRQYPEPEVAGALALLATALAPGGVLLEGTSDPLGRLLAFQVFTPVEAPGAAPGAAAVSGRRGRPAPGPEASPGRTVPAAPGLRRTAVVFAPRLRPGFAPRHFQAVLPKCFIHHAEPGGAIDGFFAAWERAWRRARPTDLRHRFARAALHLAGDHGYRVDRRPALLRRGFLALDGDWPERHPPAGAISRPAISPPPGAPGWSASGSGSPRP